MANDFDQSMLFGFLDVEEDNREQKEKLRLREGERREVTMLFADVKNSTALGSQLDPEEFHRKLDPLMKRFTRCITFYGGYVDKYMGDGVMALFGAKKATEQDTERAVMAALRMISQTELYNQKLREDQAPPEEQIGIRIGINSGLVRVGKVGEEREGDYTVIGSAVHLAQRMEANAPVNRILLPVHTKEAVERCFEFEHIGPVSAKGFAAPVDAYAVLRPKQEKDARWYRRRSLFIGREPELELLNRAFARQERLLKGIHDEGEDISVVGITGDAGLGKSRLVYEFTSALGERAQTILAAASGIVKYPFNLFSNLLGNEFRVQVTEATEEKRRKLEEGFELLCEGLDAEAATDLRKQLPLVGALLEIPCDDPRLRQSGQDWLTHLKLALNLVLLRLVEKKTGGGKPLILILDDLHWMDESSAAVFEDLMKKLCGDQGEGGKGLLLILQYRQDYVPPAALSGLPGFRQLELQPLSDNEIMRLLRYHTSGRELPESTLDKVKQLSTGNPFYLEEWCNYLEELPKHELFDLPVPNNLHALILSRLDLLDGAIRLLLQKASVIGQEFLVEILRWMEDRLYNPTDLEGTLTDLERQAFILRLLGFDYSAYFFKHIITRDVAYQTLLLENRAILHQLAAEAIEELFPERTQEFLYQLADHYHRAGVGGKASFYLEQAALAAKKAFSNRLAIELFGKLLGWMEKGEQSGTVKRWNGETESVTLASAGRSAGFSRYERSASSLTPARILLHLAEIKWLIGAWDDSDLDLKEALARAEESGETEALFDCHRLKGISSFQRGKQEQAKAEWETCLQLADSLSDHPSSVIPAPGSSGTSIADSWGGNAGIQPLSVQETQYHTLKAVVHGNLGIWHQHHKHYDEAIANHELSLRHAAKVKDELRQARSLSNLGLIHLNLKEYTKAEEHFTRCLQIAEANHYLKEQSIALGNLGYLYQRQELPDKAMDHYQRKWLLVDKMDDKAELIKVLGNIANIHRDRGEHREALEYYQKVLALKQGLGNNLELAVTHNAISAEFQTLGELDAALDHIDQAVAYTKDLPQYLCEYLYYKADVLLDMNRRYEAEPVNRKALDLAIEVNRPAVMEACRKLMGVIEGKKV
jgi:class 3 adenylate cyclase/tetratricopeptide (TPR) repeat protein